MKRLKVLHFAHTFNHNDFVDVVLRFADRSKFDMMAAVYNKTGNPQLPSYGPETPIFSMGIIHGYYGLLNGAWKLSKLLRSQRADVLHAHHFYESVMGMIACWLYPRCVLVVGRHYHNQFYLTAKGFKLWYYLKVESMVNRKSRVIISPSTQIDELLREQGVPEKKIKHIAYGFDFSAPKYHLVDSETKSATRVKYGWKNDFLIGNIGRHHQIKGQFLLIEVFSQVLRKIRNARLVMAGDGPLREDLELIVKRNGLESNVSFLGWVQDTHALLSIMDIVVHPTLQEAFPQVMVETMALEIPLVISKVSGATDIVRNGHNAILVDVGSTAQIRDAIFRIHENPTFATAIGKQARKDVMENLRIEDNIHSFEAVYQEVTSFNNR